jgi:hypothetical protein
MRAGIRTPGYEAEPGGVQSAHSLSRPVEVALPLVSDNEPYGEIQIGPPLYSKSDSSIVLNYPENLRSPKQKTHATFP